MTNAKWVRMTVDLANALVLIKVCSEKGSKQYEYAEQALNHFYDATSEDSYKREVAEARTL